MPHQHRARLKVTLVPTLPAQAGTSMHLYTTELLEALGYVPGVVAHAEWPPFGCDPDASPFRKRWQRYVTYGRWCRCLDADLFHVTDHGNAQLLLALPATKTVVTCHDLYPVAVARGWVRFPGADGRMRMTPTALRLCLLHKAAAVVAISQHTLRECRDLLGIQSERLFLAYYGVSSAFRSPHPRDDRESFRLRHGIRPEQLAVLHVGSNDPRKNLVGVLRVVATLREKLQGGVFLIKVGSRFSLCERNLIQHLGLGEAIRELGQLSSNQIAQAYQGCDILLYPSFHEGFCRPVAEAMACGTPVVASNRGAIPEVVQIPRVLFDPRDTDGMARCILQISESLDLREEIVEQGKRIARQFTWEAHGAAVAEAYRSVVKQWV